MLHCASFRYPYDWLCIFFNDTATTEIYTLSLTRRSSDLKLAARKKEPARERGGAGWTIRVGALRVRDGEIAYRDATGAEDRKSTRLNSSHANISYAVFCLKKKTERPNSRLA